MQNWPLRMGFRVSPWEVSRGRRWGRRFRDGAVEPLVLAWQWSSVHVVVFINRHGPPKPLPVQEEERA